MHSPFLFELLPFVHDRERHYYVFDEIEGLRNELLHDHKEIELLDYGAGSRTRHSRTVADIAGSSLTPVPRCRVIFRLITHLKPGNILEIGTSLGITTAYLAAAHCDTTVHTIEGNPALTEIARQIACEMDLRNITFHTGRFAEVLPELIKQVPSPGFILIDGDHRGEALLSYYQMLKPGLLTHTVIVIDDIRWSADMYDTWRKIIQDPDVTCILDYFSFGVLLFRKDFRNKLHLKIIPGRWPPQVL